MIQKYIDADALKDKMFNYYDCVNLNTRKDNYNGETLMNYEVADMIEDCIDNAPVADVQEVKYAKWVPRERPYGTLVCSNCHIGFCHRCAPYKYCYVCGRKMLKED